MNIWSKFIHIELPEPLESEYRNAQFDQHQKIMTLATFILLLGNTALFFIDWLVIYKDGFFETTYVYLRLLFELNALVHFLLIRRETHYHRLIQHFVTMVVIFAIINALLIMNTLSDAGPTFMFESMFALSIYFIYPISFRVQLAAAVGYSAMILAFKWFVYFDPLSGVTVTLLVLSSNWVGMFGCRYYHRLNRKVFKDMRESERLSEEILEKQLMVRQLKTLIPICPSCKSIRNDDGYWNRAEQYMKLFGDFVFTHSLCPACAKELYDVDISDAREQASDFNSKNTD